MALVTVDEENGSPVELYYDDLGSGPAVVLIHGYPLNGASWEKQTRAFLAAGRRVVTYDRRGFGQSSKPSIGYNYDRFADDLHALVTALRLERFALVGFSMGGGEVARYLGRHGTDRVSHAVIAGGIPPCLARAADNPEGLDPGIFEGIKQAVVADRPAFFTEFFKSFYNLDQLGGTGISDAAVQASWNVAVQASPIAAAECVETWGTDFRQDLERIDVPTLVIHGDADRIVPLKASGERTHRMVAGSRMVVIPGAPHGMLWTHATEVNAALLDFLT